MFFFDVRQLRRKSTTAFLHHYHPRQRARLLNNFSVTDLWCSKEYVIIQLDNQCVSCLFSFLELFLHFQLLLLRLFSFTRKRVFQLLYLSVLRLIFAWFGWASLRPCHELADEIVLAFSCTFERRDLCFKLLTFLCRVFQFGCQPCDLCIFLFHLGFRIVLLWLLFMVLNLLGRF